MFTQDELSGADNKAISTKVGLPAFRESRMNVTNEDFKKSKENVLHRSFGFESAGQFVSLFWCISSNRFFIQ